jgi:hypothetical protein
MKVTDEMVERAVEAWSQQACLGGNRQATRAALEAALQDVPDLQLSVDERGGQAVRS